MGKNTINSATLNTNPTTMNPTVKTDGTDAQNIRPNYKVDVVPYVTGVTTRLATKDTANGTIYSRTSSGHYPIASNEGAITLSGYNLTSGNTDVTIAATTVSSFTTGAYNYTVNGITAINNMNDNDASGDYDTTVENLAESTKVSNMYNRQPNSTTNLKLTDDIYFDVWEINSNAATSGAALKYPVMRINPTNNQIGFGFVKGSDSVSFPANGKSYLHYQKNRKDYIGTNFVYDTNGIAHNISIGLDGQFDSGIAGRMLYNNSNWYAGNDGPNKIKQWDKRYSIALESIGIPNGIYIKNQQVNVSGGQGILDTDRFATPAIAAAAHNNGTAVYIMYYDSDHDQIRFRYGEVPKNGANRTNTQYGLLNDSKSERQRHNNSLRNGATSAANNDNTDYNTATNNTAINEDTSNQNDAWVTHAMFEASKDYYALVTGDYYYQSNDGKNGTAGTLCNSTGNQGSEYYAMSVIPGNLMNNDKVVMIWYDNAAKKLMYMYRINLETNNTADNTDASSTGVANKWSEPKEIYSLPVQDVTMTVDKLNGIHIAAYDQNNADLLYIYLPTYNYLDTATNKPYVCKVDSYSQIGNKVTIETALDTAGTAAIPYISYYAEGLSSLPKVAFLTSGVNSTNAGTVVKDGVNSTNQFTGNWEVSMIPTNSALQSYNVNVGLFKNATSGKLVPTATGTNNTTAQDTRVLYGNGKSHLVVGYAIRSSGVGYIETAMYKGVPTYE